MLRDRLVGARLGNGRQFLGIGQVRRMHTGTPTFVDHVQASQQFADAPQAQRSHPRDDLAEVRLPPTTAWQIVEAWTAMHHLLHLGGGGLRVGMHRGKKRACARVLT